MGTLYAMAYPTKLFLNAADHTYVKCAGTKAWGCWGGKTGGRELGHADGSTLRADHIAEPDEHAGITCYLINGVCHQAANRILLPANITVKGARGYSLSESLYTTYGRPRGILGLCKAPFDQHPGETGEHSDCKPSGPSAALPSGVTPAGPGGEAVAAMVAPIDEREQVYLQRVRASYARFEAARVMTLAEPDLMGFQLENFSLKIDYNLGEDFDRGIANQMLDVRKDVESSRMSIEEGYVHDGMSRDEFVEKINNETIRFQQEMANALTLDQYAQFLDLSPDEPIVLADPDIVALMPGSPAPRSPLGM
jgi:hypothetical protein